MPGIRTRAGRPRNTMLALASTASGLSISEMRKAAVNPDAWTCVAAEPNSEERRAIADVRFAESEGKPCSLPRMMRLALIRLGAIYTRGALTIAGRWLIAWSAAASVITSTWGASS